MKRWAISVQDLSKYYRVPSRRRHPADRLVRAVDSVSFQVAPGEAVGFIGPNGAGKSTAIKVLTGILFPTAGTVRVMDLVPSRSRFRLAHHIGCVFGHRSQLWYHLPPRETFRMMRTLYEIPASTYRARLEYLIEAIGLTHIVDKPVRMLSLGERMRCEIAASLLHQPEVLFLDEPTIGLDVVAKRMIRDVLREASQRQGITLFLASHDSSDIERLCDRVLLLNQGKILFDGSLARLRRDYMPRKVVDVRLEEPWEGDRIAGYPVQHKSTCHLRLEIEAGREAFGLFLADLGKECRVQDLTVSDLPMEDLIYNVYQHASAPHAATPDGAP